MGQREMNSKKMCFSYCGRLNYAQRCLCPYPQDLRTLPYRVKESLQMESVLKILSWGHYLVVAVVQLLSCVWLFVTPWTAACQASYPSPSPGICSNSCPMSWWCHQIISSSVIPFSPCLQSFPASVSFSMSRFFTSGGQVLELQLQQQSFQWIFRTDFLRIDWFDLLAVQGTLKNLIQHHRWKASMPWCSAFFTVQLSFHTWLLEKS